MGTDILSTSPSIFGWQSQSWLVCKLFTAPILLNKPTVVELQSWGLQFEKEHIEGAINIPLFRPVMGNGFWDNLKKGVMKWGLAMTATGESAVICDPLGAHLCKTGFMPVAAWTLWTCKIWSHIAHLGWLCCAASSRNVSFCGYIGRCMVP